MERLQWRFPDLLCYLIMYKTDVCSKRQENKMLPSLTLDIEVATYTNYQKCYAQSVIIDVYTRVFQIKLPYNIK